jgi:hypothetical protein
MVRFGDGKPSSTQYWAKAPFVTYRDYTHPDFAVLAQQFNVITIPLAHGSATQWRGVSLLCGKMARFEPQRGKRTATRNKGVWIAGAGADDVRLTGHTVADEGYPRFSIRIQPPIATSV